MSTIVELDKNKCTGCRCCEKVCPVNAIQMIENKEGFIEPRIIEEKCINCGLCFKRCPQLHDVYIKNKLENIKILAAKSKDINNQKSSSSGGIFSVLATYILKQEGIVYGCAFNSELIAEHIRISNTSEIYKLKGSKYVQSNTKNTFSLCKQDLENNKKVLYSGTPCQIAGLKSFLGKEYDKLITVDLLCHGVPSPMLLKKYIQFLEEKNNAKIINIEFRNKEKAYWGLGYKIKVTFENNKTKFFNGDEDIYTNAFTQGSTLREACYNCGYTNLCRQGDITLGDFWGVEKTYPKLYDKNGISLLLVNTDKGNKIIELLNNSLYTYHIEYNKIEKYTDTLKFSCNRKEKRNTIYSDLESMQIQNVLKNNKIIKKKIKNSIPYFIRLIIRKIRN